MTYVNASAIWIGKLEWNCVQGLLINDLWYMYCQKLSSCSIKDLGFLAWFNISVHIGEIRWLFSCLIINSDSQVCCGPCNPSKWEADIWGWLEVRRSAILHYTVNQRPHWACRQYGQPGGTWGWLGVERWQLCPQDTSCSAKCHWQAAVGHCFIVCVL